MNNFIGVFFYLLILAITLLIYRQSDEFEPYLVWKLIGYTILGGFSFQFNEWKLPLGFLIYLLFFTNMKVNAKAKKRAVYLGLVIFLVSTIVPWIQNDIYEQPKEVAVLNTNFYEGSLAKEWENIHSKLGNRGYPVKVLDFDMAISDEGEIEDLDMYIEENATRGKVHYHITLSNEDKEFIVERRKVGTEGFHFASETLTEGEFFFNQIDLLQKPMLNEEGVDTYYLSSSGQRTNYPQTDDDSYRIDTAGKKKVKNSDLPTDAIVVDICDGDCDYRAYFLFDVLEGMPPITEDNVLDIAQQQSSEIRSWLINHTGDELGLEKDGEYFLTKDGKKEKVSKETYFKVLTETPEITINHNEPMLEVTVKNPYGDEPHQMDFTYNKEWREVNWVRFQ
ncbi:hypothetical protein [Bacillus sp. es.036]|uniref:hypothetical protein n=1 Tax=Bacillus sp. es.036 TaxID=1761764 RepID=UPI000BF7EAF8|nr:hypothetical protein [Bacillus sp. es.036]PFG12243.1 hypothetical protein ATG70_0420 [Bacillus sp. es.036]